MRGAPRAAVPREGRAAPSACGLLAPAALRAHGPSPLEPRSALVRRVERRHVHPPPAVEAAHEGRRPRPVRRMSIRMVTHRRPGSPSLRARTFRRGPATASLAVPRSSCPPDVSVVSPGRASADARAPVGIVVAVASRARSRRDASHPSRVVRSWRPFPTSRPAPGGRLSSRRCCALRRPRRGRSGWARSGCGDRWSVGTAPTWRWRSRPRSCSSPRRPSSRRPSCTARRSPPGACGGRSRSRPRPRAPSPSARRSRPRRPHRSRRRSPGSWSRRSGRRVARSRASPAPGRSPWRGSRPEVPTT